MLRIEKADWWSVIRVLLLRTCAIAEPGGFNVTVAAGVYSHGVWDSLCAYLHRVGSLYRVRNGYFSFGLAIQKKPAETESGALKRISDRDLWC